MDPTANLKEQIEIADQILEDEEDDTDPDPADAVRLAGLVHALHHWMQKGGHLPEQWKKR